MASNILRGQNQAPVRTKGNTKCVNHREKDVIYTCLTCQQLICSACGISLPHKTHDLLELTEDVKTKKIVLRDFVNDMENNRLPELQQDIASTGQKLIENSTIFKKIAQDMENCGEVCKKEIDVLVAEYKTSCQEMEHHNQVLLQQHTAEQQRQYNDLADCVKECKRVLQIGIPVDVYDAEADIHIHEENLTNTPELCTAQFCPCTSIADHLRKALGELVTLADQSQAIVAGNHSAEPLTIPHVQVSEEQVTSAKGGDPISRGPTHTAKGGDPISRGPTHTAKGGDPISRGPTHTAKGGDPISRGPTHNLLDRINIVTQFPYSKNINCICPTPDGHAWVCDGTNTVVLIDSTGQTKRTLQHHGGIIDISMAVDTALWFCCNDGTINELLPSSTTAVTRFTTDDELWCLCLTGDGCVVVGSLGKVMVYSPEGAVLHTTTVEESGVVYPWDITYCPITGNIAVVNQDGTGRHIIMYDATLTVRYYYKGWDIVLGGQAVKPDKFGPWSIVYDSVGNLVTADTKRNTIEIINREGEHIKTLLTNKGEVPKLGIQTGDVLWAWLLLDTRERVVQVIKYYTD